MDHANWLRALGTSGWLVAAGVVVGCGGSDTVMMDQGVDHGVADVGLPDTGRPVDVGLDAATDVGVDAATDAGACSGALRPACGFVMTLDGPAFECGRTDRPPANTPMVYEQSPDVFCVDSCDPFGSTATCCNYATGTLVECSYSGGSCDVCADTQVCPNICVPPE